MLVRSPSSARFASNEVFDVCTSAPITFSTDWLPVPIVRKTQPSQSVFMERRSDSVKNLLLQSSADHLVIRVSWVFGPDKPGFVDSLLDRAIGQEEVVSH